MDILNMADKGWWAAGSLLLIGAWRSFSAGRKIGGMEARMDSNHREIMRRLDRLEKRVDAHFDKGRGAG